MSETDEAWMRVALAEAERAAEMGEVPVGCVVVGADGVELARAHNLRESLQDPTAHAEVLALRAAAAHVGSWRLGGATLFVTLEPCPMCAGALVQGRVARVVYGCDDPKAGALRSLFALGDDPRLNHRLDIASGVLAELCAARMTAFFAALRALGKK
jgi:tRNA(adenine34) deaminase